MITFDRTGRSVVAVCSCGARDVFTATGPAESWARHHMALAHPDPAKERERQLTADRARRHYRNR
jgi:hypothetical protein